MAAGATCEPDRSLSPTDSYPSPTGNIFSHGGLGSPTDTPIKKNKRKLSEPRKRTDFSIKRFCPDSPTAGSAGSESGSSEDGGRLHEDPPDTPDGCGSTGEIDDPSSFHRRNGTSKHFLHSAFFLPTELRPNFIVPNLYNSHQFMGDRSADVDRLHHDGDHFHRERTGECNHVQSDYLSSQNNSKKSRKNYKNMTRERRIEANARERTRVHTISAAFDSLRRAVPSYSYNQRLSKLAILRIACSYIAALGKLADIDYSVDGKKTTFADCVDMCTQTIQTEGRARRRH